MRLITALSLATVLFLSSSCFSQTLLLNSYCKFKAFQDTTDAGNFFWNGDYFVGTINITAMKNSSELVATWNFVKIFSTDNWKTLYSFPSVAFSYECGTGFSQIKNIVVNGDQILFDLYLDAACESCSVVHMIGNKSKNNSFSGTGIQKSFVDNKFDKFELRPVSGIKLPTTLVK